EARRPERLGRLRGGGRRDELHARRVGTGHVAVRLEPRDEGARRPPRGAAAGADHPERPRDGGRRAAVADPAARLRGDRRRTGDPGPAARQACRDGAPHHVQARGGLRAVARAARLPGGASGRPRRGHDRRRPDRPRRGTVRRRDTVGRQGRRGHGRGAGRPGRPGGGRRVAGLLRRPSRAGHAGRPHRAPLHQLPAGHRRELVSLGLRERRAAVPGQGRWPSGLQRRRLDPGRRPGGTRGRLPLRRPDRRPRRRGAAGPGSGGVVPYLPRLLPLPPEPPPNAAGAVRVGRCPARQSGPWAICAHGNVRL
ncbi:MAG: Transcriptional regulator, LysR family, partial [uncultured Acetobacteraceae bacterium]